MSKSTPVIIPQENVNDESVTLVSWLAAKGEKVSEGQQIAEIETSKTAMEIEAPVAGILEYSIEVGTDVDVGTILCHILNEATSTEQKSAPLVKGGYSNEKEIDRSEKHHAETNLSTEEKVVIQTTNKGGNEKEKRANTIACEITNHGGSRFSKMAKELMEKRGLSSDQFSGRGLVRTEDILKELGEISPRSSIHSSSEKKATKAVKLVSAPIPAIGVPFRTERLSKSKRTEVNYLTSGYQNTLASIITVSIPTKGLRAAVEAHPETKGNTTAIIIFEVARLLRRYPWFNAFYSDENINYYENVNVGFAIDADQGLKVPVIPAADTKGVQEIAAEMHELIVGYLENNLPSNSLLGGTFTVTDLSAEGVSLFHPLLNQGQSAILGVGAEFFPPGSSEGIFNLILAFDHQASEGRQAAKFLGELGQHLQAYEKALDQKAGVIENSKTAEEPYCLRCLTPIGKLQEWDQFQHWDHFMVKVAQPHGKNGYLCSVCLRGW